MHLLTRHFIYQRAVPRCFPTAISSMWKYVASAASYSLLVLCESMVAVAIKSGLLLLSNGAIAHWIGSMWCCACRAVTSIAALDRMGWSWENGNTRKNTARTIGGDSPPELGSSAYIYLGGRPREESEGVALQSKVHHDCSKCHGRTFDCIQVSLGISRTSRPDAASIHTLNTNWRHLDAWDWVIGRIRRYTSLDVSEHFWRGW